MNLKDVRYLDIAKSQFNYSKDIINEIDYSKWVEYIEQNADYFVWEEDTKGGKELLSNIEKLPELAREGRKLGLNKKSALAEFHNNIYLINVGFSIVNKRIRISFERVPTIYDLRRFLEMANYLDALLLKDGTKIIDEKVIEELSE